MICWIAPNNFLLSSFKIFDKFHMFHKFHNLLVTSELTLVSWLKVDQNQIIFPMIPNFWCLKNLFLLLWSHGYVTPW